MYLAKLFVEPFSSGTFVELFLNDCGLGDVGAQIMVDSYITTVLIWSCMFFSVYACVMRM